MAVGEYTNSDKAIVLLMDTYAGSKWASTPLDLPANASETSAATSGLYFVSCPSIVSCRAVGVYTDSSGDTEGLIETLAGGKWTPSEIPRPSDAGTDPTVKPDSALSCPTTSFCLAAGSYVDTSGNTDLLVVEISKGIVKDLTVPGPAGADPGTVELDSISCSSADSCTASGSDLIESDSLEGSFFETMTGTTWKETTAPLPAGISGKETTDVGPVSCGAAGSCAAPGYYSPDNGATTVFMVEVLRSGKWTAMKASLPSNASSTQSSVFDHISCTTASSCIAVGNYVDADNARHDFADTLAGGKWTSMELSVLSGTTPYGIVSMTCVAAGSCVVLSGIINSKGQPGGLAQSLSAKVWTPIKLPLPENGSADEDFGLSVTCPSKTDCVAAGAYANSPTGSLPNEEALLETMSG